MCSQASPDQESLLVPDSVQVYENMGEWFVVVVRDGKDHVTSFELESYAKAYADGQRLGLKEPGSADKPGSPQE
ncbi:hypothetical protein EN873_27215 [bacterium M00.F.Ca.ET.230.01.1.1]|nr:hypothetical protein EN873_27215 [bacterium M00.F.Ca.ET.230.01.1.1]